MALVALLAFVAVLPGGTFVFDDHVLIEKNTNLPRGDIWRASFGRDYYATGERAGGSGYDRPLPVLVNALDWRVVGRHVGDPPPTSSRIRGGERGPGPGAVALGSPAAVAWAAALFFAVHPVHAESVAFVSGRVDVLAALGVFLALGLAASRRRYAATGVGVAALVAFLSKESAVVLPLLLLLVWMARRRDPEPRISEPTGPPGVLLAVAVGVAALVALLLRWAALGAWLPASASGPHPDAAWLLPVKTFLFSLASLAAPVRRLSLEPDPAHLAPLRLVAGLVVTLALWIAAWKCDRAARPALRRCAWAGAIALLPVLNFLPQETLLSERFLYLASGFWLLPAGVLVVAGWRRGGALQPVTIGLAALALLLLAGIATWRARAWRDDVTLWRIATREEPQRAAFWDRLGLALTEKSDFAAAEEALQRAIALDPRYFNAQFNLGVLLQSSRRPRQALEAYRRAQALDPQHVTLHLNLGLSLLALDDIPAAYAEFQRAVALKPDSPEALRLAGGCALQLGKLADARRYLQEARRLLPQHPGIQQAVQLLEEKERSRGASPPP